VIHIPEQSSYGVLWSAEVNEPAGAINIGGVPSTTAGAQVCQFRNLSAEHPSQLTLRTVISREKVPLTTELSRIFDVVEQWVAEAPDREALVFGDQRWTWAQLDDRIRRAAGALPRRRYRGRTASSR
jgi:non-ribosomal peptide synthetase component F